MDQRAIPSTESPSQLAQLSTGCPSLRQRSTPGLLKDVGPGVGTVPIGAQQ